MRDRQTDGELYTDKLHSIIILFVQIFKIIFKNNNIHWIWCENCKINKTRPHLFCSVIPIQLCFSLMNKTLEQCPWS